MAEDKMKNMQKLDVDDLDSVTGGSVFTDIAASVLGLRSNKPISNKAAQTAECCSNALKGNQSAETGTGLGGTVTAYCPVCRKDTAFEVFSGARAKCSVCGNIRLDM